MLSGRAALPLRDADTCGSVRSTWLHGRSKKANVVAQVLV
jgi:hypothetical protein